MAPMYIDDLIHFLTKALAPLKHNHFGATLRMIWIGDLYPMNMGIMMGI